MCLKRAKGRQMPCSIPHVAIVRTPACTGSRVLLLIGTRWRLALDPSKGLSALPFSDRTRLRLLTATAPHG